MLQTQRLFLRQWKEADYDTFANMCANAEVMRYFPKTLDRNESDAMADRITSLIEEKGWGFWAVEERSSGAFAGFVGLHQVKDDLPCAPSVEIGWRLAQGFWGRGLAAEAALACLQFGFEKLKLPEVVSFTTRSNVRSQTVMQRIGMHNTGCDFEHPDVSIESGLRTHVLFRITAQQWLENQK